LVATGVNTEDEMLHARRSRRIAGVIAVLLSVIATVPREASAASCSGASHQMVLSTGAASPGSGTTATSFRFSVAYKDNSDCTPSSITVTINGAGTFNLAYVSGDPSSPAGATYARSLTLPAGTHAYHFTATSGSGAGELTTTLTSVTPPMVVVVAPTPVPTPKPTPKPTPRPTPRPTPVPTPIPTPGSTPTPLIPTAEPSPAVTPVPAVSTTPAPSAAPVAVGVPLPPRPRGAVSPIDETSRPAIGSDDTPRANAQASPFDPGRLPQPVLALIVASIGTAGGLGLFMLLATPVLGLAPNGGLRLPPLARRRSRRGQPAMETVAVAAPAVAVPLPPDEVLDPAAGARRRAPILFAAPAARGVDRCHVVSRLVPLRSEPDEHGGRLLGRVDAGDEVEVIRQDGTHCLVRTPSGAEGWLPGLALTLAGGPLPEVPGDVH